MIGNIHHKPNKTETRVALTAKSADWAANDNELLKKDVLERVVTKLLVRIHHDLQMEMVFAVLQGAAVMQVSSVQTVSSFGFLLSLLIIFSFPLYAVVLF